MKFSCTLIALICVSAVKLESSHWSEFLPEISESDKIIADQLAEKVVSISGQGPNGLNLVADLVVRILDSLTSDEMKILVKYVIETVAVSNQALKEPDGEEQLTFILNLAPRVIASMTENMSAEGEINNEKTKADKSASGTSLFSKLISDSLISVLDFESVTGRINDILANEELAKMISEMGKIMVDPTKKKPIGGKSDPQPKSQDEL